MNTETSSARDWLRDQYLDRRRRNPSYSLRAFGKHLDIPAGRLSEIFSGKRTVTPALATKISQRLALSPTESEKLLAATRPAASEPVEEFRQLSNDTFHVIADWYHYAILSLLEIRGFRGDAAWIAARLGISSVEAQAALDRLVRLELVSHKRQRYVKTSGSLTTSPEVATAALKRAHGQMLEQVMTKVDETPRELRDVTSITMAIDPAKIPEAKTLIQDFRRRLCSLMESGTRREVYSLNVQLIPLSRTTKKREKL